MAHAAKESFYCNSYYVILHKKRTKTLYSIFTSLFLIQNMFNNLYKHIKILNSDKLTFV